MVEQKGALGVGIGLVVAGLVLLGVKKAEVPLEPPEPTEGEAATIVIEIVGAEKNSPAVVVEGETYPVRVTVTNTTTKVGTPWEATFNIRMVVNIGNWGVILGPTVSDEYFDAGITRVFEYLMSIPVGTGGLPGSVNFIIRGPAANVLATASEIFDVVEAEIIYGASVVIGV